MRQINDYYKQIGTARREGQKVFDALFYRLRNRLGVELYAGGLVTAVTLNERVRPFFGTYFVKCIDTDTISINNAPETTVTHDGATINYNVSGSGLDLVFSGVMTPGTESEIRVTGDIVFPEIALKMDESENIGAALEIIDRQLWNLGLLGSLHAWHRYDADRAGMLLDGAATPVHGRTITYYASDKDTWESIEDRFGIRYTDIIDYNEIRPSDLTSGLRLIIPLQTADEVVAGLNVFGSHVGRKAWGRDISRRFAIKDGDYVALNYSYTLVQSVCIILQSELWRQVGEGFPEAAQLPVMAEQLKTALLRDKRIKTVTIGDMKHIGDGVSVYISIIPIHQQEFSVMFSELDGRTEFHCSIDDRVYDLKSGLI